MTETEEPTASYTLSPQFIKFAEDIRAKIRDDWDAMAVVSGREGSGKSTLAYWLCKAVDPEFDVQKKIVYSFEELHEKIYSTPAYSALMIDEGMEIFYKRNWYKADQKKINQLLGMARQQNLFYVFCAPRFTDLDEYLRNWRIRIWIHMQDRGVGAVHLKDDEEHHGDPWHLNDAKVRAKKNYAMQIACGPIPAEDNATYKKLKRAYFEKAGGNGEVEVGKREMSTNLKFGQFAMSLNTKLGITYAKMAEVSGISMGTIKIAVNRYRNHFRTQLVNTEGTDSNEIYNL